MPYQRILDHPDIPEATKQALREYHAKLNPFVLKAAIESDEIQVLILDPIGH